MKETVFVNVYAVTREFGGHEEGGWYYNRYECLNVFTATPENVEAVAEEVQAEYEHVSEGDPASVLGGCQILVMIEDEARESETLEIPFYE